MVVMQGLILPEFNKNCVVELQKVLVFDGKWKYGAIQVQGGDFLLKSSFDKKYITETKKWLKRELPMHDACHLDNEEYFFTIL